MGAKKTPETRRAMHCWQSCQACCSRLDPEPIGMRPQQRVSGSVRGVGDPLADGLEDFRGAQFRNDQPEKASEPSLRGFIQTTDVGAGAGESFHQAMLLEIVDGPPRGNAGNVETVHQRGLAGKLLSGLITA